MAITSKPLKYSVILNPFYKAGKSRIIQIPFWLVFETNQPCTKIQIKPQKARQSIPQSQTTLQSKLLNQFKGRF